MTGWEICFVKNTIAYRIRKLRESKDYSQENMAGELGISKSAYSKIERGITDPSVGRMQAIAKILEVDVTYFFLEPSTITKVEEPSKAIGYATKADIEDINHAIKKLQQEIASIKATAPTTTTGKKKRR